MEDIIRYYLVRFLTRLAKLRLFLGDFATAEALEEEAADLTQPLFRKTAPARVRYLLMPWIHRTLIVGYQEAFEEAEQRVQRLLRQSKDVGFVEEVAAAHLTLAYRRRVSGQREYVARSIERAAAFVGSQDCNPYMRAEITLEQACQAGEEGPTVRTLRYLLESIIDPQSQADILYEQAQHVLSRGARDEAYSYSLQSLHLAQIAGVLVTVQRSQRLLSRLAEEG